MQDAGFNGFVGAFSRVQRACLLATVAVSAVALWPGSFESGAVKMPLFVLGAALLAALLLAQGLGGGGAAVSRSWLSILVPLHLLLFTLAVLFHPRVLQRWDAFAFAGGCACCFWAGGALFTAKPDLKRFISFIEWLTASLVVVGAAQLLFGDSLGLDFGLGETRRVPSLLGNAAFFSSYLVLVFPLLLGRLLSGWKEGEGRTLRMILLGFVVCMLVAARTRSSIVAWVMSMLVFGVAAPFPPIWKRRLAASVGALVVLAAIVALAVPRAPGDLWNTIKGGHEQSLERRMYFWSAGWEAFLASPVFGFGPGSYEETMLEFRSPDYWMSASEDVVPHAHNEVLEVAVEYGLVGLLLLALTLALVARQGTRIVQGKGDWRRWMGAGILAAIAGIAIDNLANVSLRQPPVAALAWTLLGLLWSNSLGAASWKTLPPSLPRVVAVVPLAAWVVLSIFLGGRALRMIEANSHLLRAIGARSRPTEALVEAQAAVTIDSTNLLALSQLGVADLGLARWADALRDIDALQRLCPNYPTSHLMRAVALVRLGRESEALQSIHAELRLRSHPETYLLAANIYHLQGDSLSERDCLTKLLEKDIEAKLPYAYKAACLRLDALSHSPEAMHRERRLLDSLAAAIPGDSSFFASLRTTEP